MYWLDKINSMKKKKSFTLEDISSLSGVPKGTLNKIFSGQTKDPQLGTIKAIVHCMGYALDDLDGNKKSSEKAKANPEDLTDGEQKLLTNYRKLNDEGKEEVMEHLEYISTKPKYIKHYTSKIQEKMEA